MRFVVFMALNMNVAVMRGMVTHSQVENYHGVIGTCCLLVPWFSAFKIEAFVTLVTVLSHCWCT